MILFVVVICIFYSVFRKKLFLIFNNFLIIWFLCKLDKRKKKNNVLGKICVDNNVGYMGY